MSKSEMRRMEFQERKQERKLDLLIHEKVFGKKLPDILDHFTEDEIPHYSTDMNATWTVVEKMSEKDFNYEIGGNNLGVGVCFSFLVDTKIKSYSVGDLGLTVPMAICKAALKALGE